MRDDSSPDESGAGSRDGSPRAQAESPPEQPGGRRLLSCVPASAVPTPNTPERQRPREATLDQATVREYRLIFAKLADGRPQPHLLHPQLLHRSQRGLAEAEPPPRRHHIDRDDGERDDHHQDNESARHPGDTPSGKSSRSVGPHVRASRATVTSVDRTTDRSLATDKRPGAEPKFRVRHAR